MLHLHVSQFTLQTGFFSFFFFLTLFGKWTVLRDLYIKLQEL